MFALALSFASAVKTNAQNRKSVGASEVNGTFRSYFKGRFKDSANEIKILALGKGRLKISFELIYPYVTGSGELSANIGEAAGEASIVGDTAVFSSDEAGKLSNHDQTRQTRSDQCHAGKSGFGMRFRS